MIVAVLNPKGGSGKSTLALNLAVVRTLQGRRVCAIDADPQESLYSALGQREEVLPPVALMRHTDPVQLRKQLKLASETYDDIVIDGCAGKAAQSNWVALAMADRVIVPVSPRSADIWALDGLVGMREAIENAGGRAAPAYAMLNMADFAGKDNQSAINAIPTEIGFLGLGLGRRKAIAAAFSRGMSVLECEKTDEKATSEMRAIADAVFNSDLI